MCHNEVAITSGGRATGLKSWSFHGVPGNPVRPVFRLDDWIP